MYAVHCTPYSGYRTVYVVHYTPYNVSRTVYVVQWTSYTIRRTLYALTHTYTRIHNIHSHTYTSTCMNTHVQYTQYDVQCTPYIHPHPHAFIKQAQYPQTIYSSPPQHINIPSSRQLLGEHDVT